MPLRRADAMPRFTADSRVRIAPFTRQVEGDETVVGRVETGAFLVLPSESLMILDALAAGATVGEAQARYQERHGEVPDIEEFLDELARRGFLQPIDDTAPPTTSDTAGAPPAAGASDHAPGQQRFHFQWLPRSVARSLFGRPALALYGGVVAAAVAAIWLDPGVVPGWRALYFSRNATPLTLILTAFSCLALFVHEMAHLLAAQSIGVPARLSLGHRLWILVAETDLTGLWTVPRRLRYLPILAGAIADCTGASLLLLLLFGERRGLFTLPVTFGIVGRAALFVYMFSLSWQCFFFVRTDLYYLVATHFGCKNLQSDTRAFLRKLLARALGRPPRRDQPQLPRHEMKVIRLYAVVWLLGHAGALAWLIFVQLPLTVQYVRLISATLQAGPRADPWHFFDVLGLAALWAVPLTAGMTLWARSLISALRQGTASAW
jgi:putative peptide zinc metalloprotease protein